MTLKTHSNLKTCSKSFEGKKKQRARAETMSKKTVMKTKKTVMKTVIKTVGERVKCRTGWGKGAGHSLKKELLLPRKRRGHRRASERESTELP